MVLDLIKFDTYLNRLLILGERIVHYSIDDQNAYTELEKAVDYSALRFQHPGQLRMESWRKRESPAGKSHYGCMAGACRNESDDYLCV